MTLPGLRRAVPRAPGSERPAEDVSLDDELPFDPEDEETGPEHPAFVWVKFAAEQAPENGLDYSAEPPSRSPPTALEVLASTFGSGAFADDIARALAPRIRQLVRPVVVPPDDAFVDQDAGLFDREVFLRLARKGQIPSTKHGQKRVARWGDVKKAFIKAAAPITLAEATDDPEVDLLDEIRQRVGLAVKGRR